jgi:prefoldin subunit 5
MSEYRESFGALQERVHALEEQLVGAKRAADEARTEATIHERSCETLRRQVERLRPLKSVKLRLWIGGFGAGVFVMGVVAILALPSPRQVQELRRRVQALEEIKNDYATALDALEKRCLREERERLR